MKYIRVSWKHTDPSYPITLYSELDESNWEIRKIEVYADGRIGHANQFESSGDTLLSTEPIPPLGVIACDPEFELDEITRTDFEQVWTQRLAHGTNS